MTLLSKRSLPAVIAGSALIGSFALAGTALAAGPEAPGRDSAELPAVVGTVASVSGTTFTVNAEDPQPRGDHKRFTDETAPAHPWTAGTIYSVNAANAMVTKDGADASVSALAAGDHVMVLGSTDGTTVTATFVHDGLPTRDHDGKGRDDAPRFTNIIGNGKPVVGGTVTAVQGTTLTLATKSGDTYSVDVSSANVNKANATSTVSAIATGDMVVVQGTVNGTSVVASSVVDHGAPTTVADDDQERPGFFRAIGGFFSRFFGFF